MQKFIGLFQRHFLSIALKRTKAKCQQSSETFFILRMKEEKKLLKTSYIKISKEKKIVSRKLVEKLILYIDSKYFLINYKNIRIILDYPLVQVTNIPLASLSKRLGKKHTLMKQKHCKTLKSKVTNILFDPHSPGRDYLLWNIS